MNISSAMRSTACFCSTVSPCVCFRMRSLFSRFIAIRGVGAVLPIYDYGWSAKIFQIVNKFFSRRVFSIARQGPPERPMAGGAATSCSALQCKCWIAVHGRGANSGRRGETKERCADHFPPAGRGQKRSGGGSGTAGSHAQLAGAADHPGVALERAAAAVQAKAAIGTAGALMRPRGRPVGIFGTNASRTFSEAGGGL